MTGRTVSRTRDNRRVLLLVLFVVLVLAGCALTEGYRLYQRNQEYLAIYNEYEAKIEAEELRKEELIAYKEYIKTDAFIEEYARSMGLVHENEIILKREQ